MPFARSMVFDVYERMDTGDGPCSNYTGDNTTRTRGRQQTAHGEEMTGPPKIFFIDPGFPHILDIRSILMLYLKILSDHDK